MSDCGEGGNSPFAKGILDTLKLNADKYLSASKLILEVKDYVSKQAQQTPRDFRLEMADDQGGDFIFHLKMSEAEIWASVVQQNSSATFQKFIERFPSSKHLAEAQEAVAWIQAKEENTKPSLSGFIKKVNESFLSEKYRPLAMQALYLIEEQDCWESARANHTLHAYFDYLSRFKSGSHWEEASRRIDELLKDDEDKAFKKVLKQDSLNAVHEYLENSDVKKYQKEAANRLSALSLESAKILQEQSSWEKAQKIGTYAVYRDFVETNPESRFFDQASKNMKLMDDVAWKEIQFLEYNNELSSDEKVSRCIAYFENFPGADNNVYVKQMKDELEIEKYNQKNISVNSQHDSKNRKPGTRLKLWSLIKKSFLKMLL